MKKIKNSFNENLYYGLTKAGLPYYYLHRPGFKKSSAVLAVPFGALNIEQKVKGVNIKHLTGLAHFLEHKLFEDDKEDILSQFSSIGASANAFTSYEHTMYYFRHPNALFPSLKLLLDFVFELKITENGVQKEKPIITEEIKMYEQIPDMILLNETYRSVYHEYPFIYDIAGTVEDVNLTSLQDLKQAYDFNYQAHRMVLVIIGPENPKNVQEFLVHYPMEVKPKLEVEDVFPLENKSVKLSRKEIQSSNLINKMSLTFKMPYLSLNRTLDRFKILKLLEMTFSTLNPKYEKWLEQEIISEYFTYDVDIREGLACVYFFNETDYPKDFEDLMIQQVKNLRLNAKDFEQVKKRTFGEQIMSLSSYNNTMIQIARSHFENSQYFEFLNEISKITYEEIVEIKEKLMWDEFCFVLMKKKT